jgi:uncharacterized protein (TIGR03083 family)
VEVHEYLPSLRRSNARFAEAATTAVLDVGWRARVPACPGWSLADLVWHLAEVQRFWAWVVRTRAQDPSHYERATRHPDDELLAYGAARSAELEAALAAADPALRVWTWTGTQDLAWVLRRQAQEAVVHTVDAEQVLGDVRPVPADLGLDGIEEWLEVMVPGALPDGPPAGAHPVVLHAVDADAERTLFPGARDLPAAVLTGTAGDLLLAVWRRLPLEALTVDGDAAIAAAMLASVDLE